MKSMRRLFPYLQSQWQTVAMAFGCMIFYAITTAFYAFISGPALKYIFTGDVQDVLKDSTGEIRSAWKTLPDSWLTGLENLAQDYALWLLPAIIVVAATAKGFAQAGQFYLMGKVSQRSLLELRRDVFRALVNQPPSFFIKRSHGDLLSRLSNDANQVEQALFYGVGPLFREPLVLFSLLGYLFYTDAKLALLTFITVPVAVIPLVRFTKWLKKVSGRGQQAQASINTVSYEALAGIQVVQAFGGEKREEKRLHQAGLHYYSQMLISYFIRAVRTPIMEILGAVALALLLGVLAWLVHHHDADPAHYMSFFAAFLFMYDPLKRLGRVADFLATGEAATERLLEIAERENDVVEKSGATILPSFQRNITLENIGFSYGDKTVLNDVSLQANQGEIIALVGASGAGKTTLVNLIIRFMDASTGTIKIDGTDISDVTLSSLRHQISVVSQETFLFNTTLAQNIAYGNPDALKQDIEQAAQAACAHEFINELENGYETIVGERGITLSGGQKQRISIARALLKNAPILILDEATSALDVESERHVQTALEKLMEGRTSFVIAHRLSTIRRAHKIAVLKAGDIVELGTHEQLLQNQGEYSRLYQMQFSDAEPSMVNSANSNTQ